MALDSPQSESRRDFLRVAGAGTLGVSAGFTGAAATAAAPNGPYNIVFILVDQERLFRPGELPHGYSLPALHAGDIAHVIVLRIFFSGQTNMLGGVLRAGGFEIQPDIEVRIK